jgi:hypothetical protein
MSALLLFLAVACAVAAVVAGGIQLACRRASGKEAEAKNE